MVKHTKTIRWLLPTICLSMFDHFVWLALKALMLFAHLAYSYKYDFDASIQQA